MLKTILLAAITLGVPEHRDWNVCTTAKVATQIVDQYKLSVGRAYSAFDYAEEQQLCTYMSDTVLIVRKPIHAVTGADGGHARVFEVETETGRILYWIWVE